MIGLTLSEENFAEEESVPVHETDPGQWRQVETNTEHHRLLSASARLVDHGEVPLHDEVDVL